MAYSQTQWDRAKFLFELGYSLRDIEEDCGISNGQISKKAKKEQWKKEADKQAIKSDIMALDKKKEALDSEKEALLPRIASLSDFEITILDGIVNDKDGTKSFVMSTTTLSLIRKNQLLTKNTKQITEFETTYSEDGKPLMKSPKVIDIELSPNDLKLIDEGIDKNIISMELAPRHAPKIEVNTQNNQITHLSVDEISKAVADGLPD